VHKQRSAPTAAYEGLNHDVSQTYDHERQQKNSLMRCVHHCVIPLFIQKPAR